MIWSASVSSASDSFGVQLFLTMDKSTQLWLLPHGDLWYCGVSNTGLHFSKREKSSRKYFQEIQAVAQELMYRCYIVMTLYLRCISVISFSICFCQFRVFLIILNNSIITVFSVTASSNVDLHFFFFILKISCMQRSFTFRVTLNYFFFLIL